MILNFLRKITILNGGVGIKKILVTGGAGFIGLHLAKHLASKNYNVAIADNLFRGKLDTELRDLIGQKKVSFIKCDLTYPKELKKLDNDYEHVYHLAAINGTRYFYEIPHIVLKVNILSVINILEWFLNNKKNDKKIMFMSSSETYAGTIRKFGAEIPTKEDIPLTIDDVKNERWSYGGSKIVGELFFVNYAKQYKFNMSIVRYHNIYGPRMGHEHVIPQFCQRILRKEDPFKILGSNETRAFCYIDDAVKATQMVMESNKTNGEIIHIGNDKEEIKIIDLAKIMFEISGFRPKLELKPALEGSVMRRCPSIDKLRRLTGFGPKVSLKEGLKKTFEWYKAELSK